MASVLRCFRGSYRRHAIKGFHEVQNGTGGWWRCGHAVTPLSRYSTMGRNQLPTVPPASADCYECEAIHNSNPCLCASLKALDLIVLSSISTTLPDTHDRGHNMPLAGREFDCVAQHVTCFDA